MTKNQNNVYQPGEIDDDTPLEPTPIKAILRRAEIPADVEAKLVAGVQKSAREEEGIRNPAQHNAAYVKFLKESADNAMKELEKLDAKRKELELKMSDLYGEINAIDQDAIKVRQRHDAYRMGLTVMSHD